MPATTFTRQNISKLPALYGRHTDYREIEGLELRVTPAGHRSYAVTYYRGRRHRRYTIGSAGKITLAQARAEAKRILALATLGGDPHAEKLAARQAQSVKGLGEAFLVHVKDKVRPSTFALWKGILGHRVYTKIGGLNARDVTRADIRGLVESIANDAPVMANRTLQLLGRVYRWAVGRDLVPGSPCVGVERPTREEPSDRVLSPTELVALQAALCTTGDEAADVVWLLLYTGVRLRMVTGMRKDELRALDEPARALWTVAGGYGGRSKNRKAHVVPLVPAVVRILDRRLKVAEGALVFPGASDRRNPMAWRSKFVAMLVERLEAFHETAVSPWTIHNLRHTMRTHLREHLGARDDVAELILGHVRPGVSGIYNRSELLEERRAALVAWADWLEELRRRRPRVVPFAAPAVG